MWKKGLVDLVSTSSPEVARMAMGSMPASPGWPWALALLGGLGMGTWVCRREH